MMQDLAGPDISCVAMVLTTKWTPPGSRLDQPHPGRGFHKTRYGLLFTLSDPARREYGLNALLDDDRVSDSIFWDRQSGHGNNPG